MEFRVRWGNFSRSIFDPKWGGVRGGVTRKLAARTCAKQAISGWLKLTTLAHGDQNLAAIDPKRAFAGQCARTRSAAPSLSM